MITEGYNTTALRLGSWHTKRNKTQSATHSCATKAGKKVPFNNLQLRLIIEVVRVPRTMAQGQI